MVLRVVVLKSVLSSVPPDPNSQQLFCGIVIGLLSDLADNCVVLVDEAGSTTKELFEAARGWPIKFRKSVLNLLTVLRTRNRFVRIPNGYPLSEKCAEPTCRLCIGIANALVPDAIFAAGPCVCSVADLKVPVAVQVHDYSTSDFHTTRKSACVFQLNPGEWDQPTFERRVLVPLFSYPKLVKIYDRWIGNSITTRQYDEQVLDITQVTDRFRAALDWIVQVFLRVCTQPTKRLEIYSSIDTRNKDRKEIGIVVRALKAFEQEVRSRYNFPQFAVIIKEETARARMLHSRYLITDQIGIMIERGIDLLVDDAGMRHMGLDPNRDARRIQDFVVTYCPEAAKVENVVRALPDLR
jgi:hypothetical protein